MSNVIPLVRLQPAEPADPGGSPEPRTGECLPCFVRRRVDAGGCTGTLVWTEHWRRARSPRASALLRRLEQRGVTCDCALVTTLWSPSLALWQWAVDPGELAEPQVMPACHGVRPRSTHPCAHWAEQVAEK